MRLGLVLATLVLGAITAPAFAGETDVALFGADPGNGRGMACFVRHYDKGHLATHPEQNVTDMALLVDSTPPEAGEARFYQLSMGVKFRNVSNELQVSGFCGDNSDGKPLLNCGIDFDGGQIDVRLRDSESILVEIPYGARTWDPDAPEDAEPSDTQQFGPDDKLFRLDRADIYQCESLVYDEELRASLRLD